MQGCLIELRIQSFMMVEENADNRVPASSGDENSCMFCDKAGESKHEQHRS
jgi:hypothetical protein